MPVGGAILGAGALGAGASIFGSVNAASAQRDAAAKATDFQKQMFAQGQTNMAPFLGAGKDAWGLLAPLLGLGDPNNPLTGAGGPGAATGFGGLIKPFAPTMDQLAQTPGYQFALDQGTKATQNSFAAKGLGSSGAAMKGAADYAQGLASNTFQQQFQDYWSQNQSIYNNLFGPTQMGAQTAGQSAGQAMQLGGQVGGNIIGAGNAQAAMYNGIGGAIGNLGNAAASAAMFSGYGNTSPSSITQGSPLFGNYGATPDYAAQQGNWWQQAGQGTGPWAAGASPSATVANPAWLTSATWPMTTPQNSGKWWQ